MFCPKGFVSLAELNLRIPLKIAAPFMADVMGLAKEFDKKKNQTADRFLYQCSLADFMDYLLFASVKDNLFAASPNGTLNRICITPLNKNHLTFNLSGMNFVRLLTRGEMPWDFVNKYHIDINMHVDDAAILSIVKSDAVSYPDSSIALYSYRTIPMFYERVGYTIDLQGFDWGIARRDPDGYEWDIIGELAWQFSPAASLLKPFEGWAICVEEDYVSRAWLENLQQARSHIIGQDRSTEIDIARRGGRPDHAFRAAASAYGKLYPNGHGGASWKEVLKKVTSEARLDFHMATLKRAVTALQNGNN